MKKCSTCKKELGLENFNKQKGRKFGVSSQCKECKKKHGLIPIIHEKIKKRSREYYKNNLEKRKEYVIKNKDIISLKAKKYRQRPVIKERNKYKNLPLEKKEKKRKWAKEYRLRYPDKVKKATVRWKKENLEKILKYREEHKEEKKVSSKIWREKNKEILKIKSKKYNLKNKIECFNSYGGCFCNCCGEKEISFLSLDHTNGGGNKERKQLKIYGGNRFYRYLQKLNYPNKNSYQVLCMNCQFGKTINNGVCPHKKDVKFGVNVVQRKYEVWLKEQQKKGKYLEVY